MDGPRPRFVYWNDMKYVVRSLLLSLVFVAVLGCDKATPTAPSGSTLAISASPSVIGLNGTSTITIIGRQPNGSPMREGTEVRLSSTLGTVTPLVTFDRDGNATATLRGDGRTGAATVTAQAGTATGGGTTGGGTTGGEGGGTSSGSLSVQTTVQIGEAATSITLQATPTNISSTGNSTVQLLAVVRGSGGRPLANAAVNFQTEYGSLASGGRLVQTNDRGEARDTLTVRQNDLANEPPNVTVTAQTAGGGEGSALINATFEIQVRTSRLDARFTWTKGTGDTTAVFNSTVSGGSGQYRYTWDFGDGTPTSASPDPAHTYPQGSRTYFVTLTVTDSQTGQSDVSTANVPVPVTSGNSID
jgi:hypothetical protein